MSGINKNLKKKRMPVKAAPESTPNTNKRRELARRRRMRSERMAKILHKERKAEVAAYVKEKYGVGA